MRINVNGGRLAVLAVLAATALGLAADAVASETVYAEALAKARTSGQLVVIDFYTDW
jgi:hypothetical protein